MMSELFAQGPRPAATSISGAVNWFANFIVGISFPAIQVKLCGRHVIKYIKWSCPLCQG